MTRSFDGTPVDAAWLGDLCASALWAPTAGNAAGVRFNVIDAKDVDAFFKVATDAPWRARSRRYEGLRRAGAVVLVTTRPQDYLERYSEPDKAASGLGDADAWPLPYWHTDAAMATMALLLLLEESEWQATLWGSFHHDEEVLSWAGLTDEQLFASVLIGRSDGNDVPSRSLERPVPSRRARVRHVEP
jgi:nitroreductase